MARRGRESWTSTVRPHRSLRRRRLWKIATALGAAGRGVNRLAIDMGMIPRGEVGLIFAGIGTSLMLQGQPVLSQAVFSAIVLMVLVTTLLAPVGLRWAFRRASSPSE